MSGETVTELLQELAALEDPKMRAVNEKHGDDHGVNLSKLRAIAKRLKTQQDLARELWATGDTAGWALTSDRVVKKPDGLDLDDLLSTIEAEMKDAPKRRQQSASRAP